MRGAFAIRGWLAALGLAVLGISMPSIALASTTTLRFTHPDEAEVVEFRVHIGQSSGVYHSVVSVGIPGKVTDVFHATVDIPANSDVYIAVSAVNADGISSSLSNEQMRYVDTGSVALTPPGTPVVVAN